MDMTLEELAEGVALVEQAKNYALKMHGNQKYGDEGLPYSVHLEAVEAVLIEFNHISSFLRAAAWLHDVKEDTPAHDFEILFPEFLVIVVECLSTEPGVNRNERNKKTYPKIARYLESKKVKLADRIANGRESKWKNNSMFKKYKLEYPDFRAALYGDGDIELLPMWRELDRLFEYEGI